MAKYNPYRMSELMDEEKNLITERQFCLTMMACSDSVILEANKVGYTKISDDYKKQKEDWHQKWKSANSRLKEIDREISEFE